jgi:uncharacterized membrane protein
MADARQSPDPLDERLASLLGWASLGLGVPMLAAPRRFVRAIGIDDDTAGRNWTLLVGVRELAAAAGLLVLDRPRPAGWAWARVAGDVKDLALLASAWGKRRDGARLAASMGAVAGIGALDLYAAMRMSRDAPAGEDRRSTTAAVTVRRPRDEVYAYWHRFENLPTFMDHVASVEVLGDGRSHWRLTGPAGRTLEWEAELVRDVPAELIAWRSLPGARVTTSGTVRFDDAPGGRGTEVRLVLDYAAPGGALLERLAKIELANDLRRFKQVIETGEVVRSDGSPEGQTAHRLLKQRPAQPLDQPLAAAIGGSES